MPRPGRPKIELDVPPYVSTRIASIPEETAQRLERAHPLVRRAMIERLLPPGYVVSSPERESCISVLVAIAEHAIEAQAVSGQE